MMSMASHFALLEESESKLKQTNYLISSIDFKINQKVKNTNRCRSNIVWTTAFLAGIGLFLTPEDWFGSREDRAFLFMCTIFPGSLFACIAFKIDKDKVESYKFKNSFLFPFTPEQLGVINESGIILNETCIGDALAYLNQLKKNLEEITEKPSEEINRIKKYLPNELAKTDLTTFSCRLFKDLFMQKQSGVAELQKLDKQERKTKH